MNEGLIFLIVAPLLVAGAWFAYRRRGLVYPPRTATPSQLAEMVRSAEVANNGFFRSLELVQKNLEALIARAENAELRLRSLMLHPSIEKREQYTAAALLLAEGHDVERVSSMLGLPEAQVHLIRELQQVTGKEKRPGRIKKTEESAVKEAVRQSRIAAPLEKTAARPILLVDVLKNAAAIESRNEESVARFKGEKV
ncbi:MAG: hypothetical protein OEN50_09960 [Deltaproteobacteria bacterium]|nr:hypothetical protein [Deltaproteobacteria bacterium]